MGDPFLGEIKIVSFDYPPVGWAFCDGAVLGIAQNQALFSLLGTIYGGDGVRTFGLPDLRGRVMTGWGTPPYSPGMAGGERTHQLTTAEMAAHGHYAAGTSARGTTPVPTGNVFANPGLNAYSVPSPPQPVAQGTVGALGGGQPHDNMSPYLVVGFVIALVGVYPSRA